jgi:hypothetical protein
LNLLGEKSFFACLKVINNVVHRLRLKAQPIEPVYKISLEFPVIHYLPLFLEFLLLDTKN